MQFGENQGEGRALCVFNVGAHRQGNILYPAGKPGKTCRKKPQENRWDRVHEVAETSRKRGRGRMQELNLRSLPAAPHDVSNDIQWVAISEWTSPSTTTYRIHSVKVENNLKPQ